eukprot:2326709-Prymnesium_polylepis.1
MAPEIARAFAAFNADNSGTIEARELRPALQQLGLEASSDETRAILRRYDSTGDARLQLEEFTRLVEDIRAYTGAPVVTP